VHLYVYVMQLPKRAARALHEGQAPELAFKAVYKRLHMC